MNRLVCFAAFLALLLACLAASASSSTAQSTESRVRGRFHTTDVEASGTGVFDVRMIQRMIDTRRAAITRCYETALASAPATAGVIRMTMTIVVSGALIGVRSLQDTTGSTPLVSCLTHIIQGFRFNPGPEGGPVTYVVPFIFEPVP